MYFKITRKKERKRFVTNYMTEMICFYCTSFVSLKHVVVHMTPNIIMMAICRNDGWIYLKFCGFLHGRHKNFGWLILKKNKTKQHSSSGDDNTDRMFLK